MKPPKYQNSSGNGGQHGSYSSNSNGMFGNKNGIGGNVGMTPPKSPSQGRHGGRNGYQSQYYSNSQSNNRNSPSLRSRYASASSNSNSTSSSSSITQPLKKSTKPAAGSLAGSSSSLSTSDDSSSNASAPGLASGTSFEFNVNTPSFDPSGIARRASRDHKINNTKDDGDGIDLLDLVKEKKGKIKEKIVSMLSLLYDPPVEGCQLRPYVAITNTDGSTIALRNKDSEEAAYRWYRGQKRICSNTRCDNAASVQCLSCVKSQLLQHMSYFCSMKCLKDCWMLHRQLHHRHPLVLPTQDDPKDAFKDPVPAGQIRWNSEDGDDYKHITPDDPSTVSCKFPPPCANIWAEVSRERCYIPTPEDVGRALRLDCAPFLDKKSTSASLASQTPKSPSPVKSSKPPMHGSDSHTTKVPGAWFRLDTSGVLPAPKAPPPRAPIFTQQPNQAQGVGHGFKVMCYNILAQIYATRHMYPYCPVWALAWNYRKKNLLRNILSHDSDVICLQEVQANHFEKFFQPLLSKSGYDGIFKHKTREPVGEHAQAIDGCAIFYKRDRFALMEQYGIEFNEAARQKTSNSKALRRLMRGNVALVVVLEELHGGAAATHRRRKRRLCVATTHIFWDPEYADVKLWQTWVLLQELEKLIMHRNYPLVLCGDFNSMPDSSVYQLLTTGQVHPSHKDFDTDTMKILPPASQLTHRLPLMSTYGAIGEPKYTNYTGHFVGVLDYIMYTKNHMTCTNILDVDPESRLKQYEALPSPQYPSDHISLVSELDWLE